MADVTISQLTQGSPSSIALIPYSQGGNTLSVAPSALLQNAGNIGIGTSSPNGTLAVVNNRGNGIILQSSASSPNTSIILITNYNNTGRVALAASSEGTTRPGMSLITGDTEQVLISREGYITKPYQAGFKATITSQSQSTGQTILWDTVEYANPSGSFNTSTGEWTVPQTGRYLITVNLISARNTTSGDWYVDLYVNSGQPNGSRMYTSKAGNANVHAQLNANGIFKLTAADKIKTILTSQVGNVTPTVLHNLFCAELLG
jgi:hypothetical protein